jgi:hypothetical protein
MHIPATRAATAAGNPPLQQLQKIMGIAPVGLLQAQRPRPDPSNEIATSDALISVSCSGTDCIVLLRT